MEQFTDLFKKIKVRNLRIDNPSSYHNLVKYINDMKKKKNKRVKNELLYYTEQARLKMISFYQSFILPAEEVDEIFKKVDIEATR